MPKSIPIAKIVRVINEFSGLIDAKIADTRAVMTRKMTAE
jgi:hypothetical protein